MAKETLRLDSSNSISGQHEQETILADSETIYTQHLESVIKNIKTATGIIKLLRDVYGDRGILPR